MDHTLLVVVLGIVVASILSYVGVTIYRTYIFRTHPFDDAKTEKLLDVLDKIDKLPVPEAIKVIQKEYPGVPVKKAGRSTKLDANTVWYSEKFGVIQTIDYNGSGVAR